MSSSAKTLLTLDEYLAIEAASGVRHEFLNGDAYALARASLDHATIQANLVRHLGNQLDGRPCRVVSGDLRVRVVATGLYTYPDVVVLCGEPRLDTKAPGTLLNPIVLVEVLSESTESYDRGEKSEHYRRIASLREYLLVAEDRRHVEQYVRQESGHWLLRDVDEPGASVELPSIGCRLTLEQIYDRVALAPTSPGSPEEG